MVSASVESGSGWAEQHHLLDAVETLAVEAEGLFKQNPVLHRPLVRERSEVGEVGQGLLDVVLVPEEHAQGLEGETGSERVREREVVKERET